MTDIIEIANACAIDVPLYKALELDTARQITGYFYAENGYYMREGVPDQDRPVIRYYIVDEDGVHHDIAEDTLEQVTLATNESALKLEVLALREALETAKNGINWYIENSDEANGCDDEALEKINEALTNSEELGNRIKAEIEAEFAETMVTGMACYDTMTAGEIRKRASERREAMKKGGV